LDVRRSTQTYQMPLLHYVLAIWLRGQRNSGLATLLTPSIQLLSGDTNPVSTTLNSMTVALHIIPLEHDSVHHYVWKKPTNNSKQKWICTAAA
jgi:hypothetical protein